LAAQRDFDGGPLLSSGWKHVGGVRHVLRVQGG
jgi:hypothetical protein